MISCRQIFLGLLVSFSSCKNDTKPVDKFHFTGMKAGETNITFNNKITESDSINVFTNEYMYNGSGVAIGDFNRDGLQDVFFCGSMVSSRLYINRGNFKFEDVTEKAGLATDTWCTGASVVDINSDGYPDIYVCVSHSKDGEKRRNRLFVNDGKLHFSDEASSYGLADTGCATQAAFFDFDKDGDLDMYLLNHRLYSHTANNLLPIDSSGNSPAQDRLYRNDGMQAGETHPVYHDVSVQAGIREDGYGLGLVITDVNNDNWPDIYVANDYIGNDLLWLNNKNGTFSNIISTATRHQSYNSMGVDAADINNDLLPDLVTLDMLPETNERKKMMPAGTNQEKYDMQQRLGYQASYVRNMLQLNNGVRKYNGVDQPFYSEIGQMAGIFETDWSWSVLMADMDNDGWKDIYITNGLAKDVTNNDYTTFKNVDAPDNNYAFSAKGHENVSSEKNMAALRKGIDEYGSVQMENYLFHNDGKLGFTDVSKQAGLTVPSISNGAAYADLDNDGDLDLVVNNMNQEAFVLRNEVRTSAADSTNNYISIGLKGAPGNTKGLGSKVYVYNHGITQFAEQSPVRGFSSSVDDRLYFGVGSDMTIDSVTIQWPDNKLQVLKNVKTNQAIVADYNTAAIPSASYQATDSGKMFYEAAEEYNIHFKHDEASYYDFAAQRGVPQKFSQLGPCMAVGDINGDGLDDVFVGGAAQQSGKLFIQERNGTFTTKDLEQEPKIGEDLGAAFFDSDGDKDLDLLITGGSPEFGSGVQYNKPRLYNNDGKGNFTLNAAAIPNEITGITKAVAVADYDQDGDMDVFIGGRVVPGKYPTSPASYLLQNDHGMFKDVTVTTYPGLQKAGMITDALWSDFDNDGIPDLIICGDWMTVRFLKNNKGKLSDITDATGLGKMSGLWRSLYAVDIDRDGDMDYVAGNMGTNNKFHITAGKPMRLYVKDMDANGIADIIPAYYIRNGKGGYEEYPGYDRNQLSDEVPSAKKKYLLHAEFSRITMTQLMNDYGGEGWTTMTCEATESVWLENLGNGKFRKHVLPLQAQVAPVNAIVATDVNSDGNVDIIIAGNEYQADISTGRYDASYGQVLAGNGKGDFTPVRITASGFITDGDVKSLNLVHVPSRGNLLLAGINNSALQCFALNRSNKR